MRGAPGSIERQTVGRTHSRALISSCWRSHPILLPTYLGQFILSHAGVVITGTALSAGELRELWLVYLIDTLVN